MSSHDSVEAETAFGAAEVAVGVAKAATKPRRGGKGGKSGKPLSPAKKGAVKPKRGPTKGTRASGGKRTGTKQDQLIAMLRSPEGVTVDQVVKSLDWQPHTARGAISGAIKKKLGLKVVSEKVDGRGRVYRIAD